MYEDTSRYRTLSNGAIYDMEVKRIVANPGGGTAAITSETASAMQARRLELKRERVAAGANAAVQDGGRFDGRDLDFVEAIAEIQAVKALNPDDPKSTDAARFIFQEAGLSEKTAQAQAQDALPEAVRLLAGFAAALREADGRQVVEGQVVPDADGTAQAGGRGVGEDDGG